MISASTLKSELPPWNIEDWTSLDAGLVFAGRTITVQDARRDYGEDRFITAGHLAGRCIVLVWTPRGEARRIISMRYAHGDEEARWFG